MCLSEHASPAWQVSDLKKIRISHDPTRLTAHPPIAHHDELVFSKTVLLSPLSAENHPQISSKSRQKILSILKDTLPAWPRD